MSVAYSFDIETAVEIGLDALDEPLRRAIETIIRSRDVFVSLASDPSRVRRLLDDEPIYGLSVPGGLLIVYREADGNIEIIDLMNEAALRRYGSRPVKDRAKPPKA